MKAYKIDLILAFSLIVINCSLSQSLEESSSVSYFNIEYLKCMEANLPCECEMLTETYFYIIVDTVLESESMQMALLKYKQMELYYYQIEKSGQKSYSISGHSKNNYDLDSLIFNNDSLLVYHDEKVSTYVKMHMSQGLNSQAYLKDNITLINKAFEKRGYPTLAELLGKDSLQCECNKWMKGVNLLSVYGKSDSWILEQDNDNMLIYEIMNLEAEPDEPIVKQKIYEFKWIR